jgi:hypothetical protein
MLNKLMIALRLSVLTAGLLFVAGSAHSSNSIVCPTDDVCGGANTFRCAKEGQQTCDCPSGQTPFCVNNNDGGDFCVGPHGFEYFCGNTYSCICE